MIKSKFIVVFAIGLSFSFPAIAKLYKWVDDRGVTHYGETVPPEYANRDREELSKSGRIVNTEDVQTPEEIRAERAARKQEKAKRREDELSELESKRHDQMLVNTYSSSEEIDLARKRNLQQFELRITGVNAQIKIMSDNLISLKKEADSYISSNKEIPSSLQEDINLAQKRLVKLNEDLVKAQSEETALEERFNADKARYKELTGK